MSMLTTLLLIDAIEKGGPGSGPHVLSAGAMDSLRRLSQYQTPEGQLAATRLAEFESRQGSADIHVGSDTSSPSAPKDPASKEAEQASNAAFKASDTANRTGRAADHDAAIKLHGQAYKANMRAGRNGGASVHGRAIARHTMESQAARSREHSN